METTLRGFHSSKNCVKLQWQLYRNNLGLVLYAHVSTPIHVCWSSLVSNWIELDTWKQALSVAFSLFF